MAAADLQEETFFLEIGRVGTILQSGATVRLVDVCDGGATPSQMGIWGLPKSDVALFGRDNVTPMVYSQRQQQT